MFLYENNSNNAQKKLAKDGRMWYYVQSVDVK